ncbi:hypothetical protein DFQ27_003218 [Actinomortierella ambigua]|uniref:Uncharacterized protein n=1 Tax=Actinomortierella ambigua TaxID=1343610 RepID=A0A9P6Q761_9FUNG|nr:hypothetical protein DFQ27_003218 [Actinomortierella ambigua]
MVSVASKERILRSAELLDRVTPGAEFWRELSHAVKAMFYTTLLLPEAVDDNGGNTANEGLMSTSLQSVLKWILETRLAPSPSPPPTVATTPHHSRNAREAEGHLSLSWKAPAADCALHIIRLMIAMVHQYTKDNSEASCNNRSKRLFPTPVCEVMLGFAVEMCPIVWRDQPMLVFEMAMAVAQMALDVQVRDSANGCIRLRSFLLGEDESETYGVQDEEGDGINFPVGLVLDLCMDVIVDQIVLCVDNSTVWTSLEPLFSLLTRPVPLDRRLAFYSPMTILMHTLTTTSDTAQAQKPMVVPLLRLLPARHPRYKAMAEHLVDRWLAEQVLLDAPMQSEALSCRRGLETDAEQIWTDDEPIFYPEQRQQELVRHRRVAVDILALLGASPSAHDKANRRRGVPVWLQEVARSRGFASLQQKLALEDEQMAADLFKGVELQKSDKIRIQVGFCMLQWASGFCT